MQTLKRNNSGEESVWLEHPDKGEVIREQCRLYVGLCRPWQRLYFE